LSLRVLLGAAAVLAAAFCVSAWAQNAARGEALAHIRGCAQCHGAQGVSEMALVPSLAGQHAEHSTLQMILFREGLRRVPPMVEAMRGLMHGLTDADIRALAHFLSQQD